MDERAAASRAPVRGHGADVEESDVLKKFVSALHGKLVYAVSRRRWPRSGRIIPHLVGARGVPAEGAPRRIQRF